MEIVKTGKIDLIMDDGNLVIVDWVAESKNGYGRITCKTSDIGWDLLSDQTREAVAEKIKTKILSSEGFWAQLPAVWRDGLKSTAGAEWDDGSLVIADGVVGKPTTFHYRATGAKALWVAGGIVVAVGLVCGVVSVLRNN